MYVVSREKSLEMTPLPSLSLSLSLSPRPCLLSQADSSSFTMDPEEFEMLFQKNQIVVSEKLPKKGVCVCVCVCVSDAET